MTVTYRSAKPDDAVELDRLFKDIFCGTFAHFYRPKDLDVFLTSFTVAGWEEQLGDQAFAFRIAEAGGSPVGFAKLGPLKLPIATDASSLMLYQLYVKPDFQGSGIAQALMDWTIEEARRRSASALYLTVFIENHRAQRFYDRYGFEPVGPYNFMVGSQADEDTIMKKVL